MKKVTEADVYQYILEEGKTPLEITRYLSETEEINPRGLLRQVYVHLNSLQERGHVESRSKMFRDSLRKHSGLDPQRVYRVTSEGAKNWLNYEDLSHFRFINPHLEGA